MFAQGTSLAGQLDHQWAPRFRPQEAALKEVAITKLRRHLVYDKSSNCTDIALGDLVLFFRVQNRKSLPCWRGPAGILHIDETGVAATLQSQTLKVARLCVRSQLKEKAASDEGW